MTKVLVEDTLKSQIPSSVVLGFPTCLRSWGSKHKVQKHISNYAGSGVLKLNENVKYFRETVQTMYFSLFVFAVFNAFFFFLLLVNKNSSYQSSGLYYIPDSQSC